MRGDSSTNSLSMPSSSNVTTSSFLVLSFNFASRTSKFFSALYHLLDRIILLCLMCFFLQERLLFQSHQSVLLKYYAAVLLTVGSFSYCVVADNDSIIVPCCDTCTELFTVCWLEIFFCCHKDVGSRIQGKEFRTPLFC